MDARQTRGLEIAATTVVTKQGNAWIVPSQTEAHVEYRVTLDSAGALRCTCPDHRFRYTNCKHIYAAAYAVQREANRVAAALPLSA